MNGGQSARWSAEQAWAWQDSRRWLCGFNYLPSTAVNSTEMWQRETFDPDTLRRELGWAGDLGLNGCRVFLPFLVWEAEADGLLERIEQFLAIAEENGIATLPVLFDDCAFAGREPYLGPQEEPVSGVHNSGWTPSPGPQRADDPAAWPRLQQYVTTLVSRFAADPRILGWDVYNEPGNSDRFARSLPLLQAAFRWVRQASPTQPLTAGIWAGGEKFREINDFLLAESDVVSFHEYGDLEHVREALTPLRALGRPVLCTEWMSRTQGSRFETHLPFFRQERVGSFFWGLTNGRTQTHFPWGSPAGAPSPVLWFHDLLEGQGKPYRAEEAALIRQVLRTA